MANKRIIWIDCEMTGLRRKDKIVEIACVVTEADLSVVGERIDIVIHQPDDVLTDMSEWCKKTFTANGLLDRIRSSTISIKEAENQVLNLLTKYTKKGMCPLAGSSVSVDRLFINRQMQNLAAHLHYRTIDVSSFKEIVKRWYPEKYATMPAKIGKHRAVDDILESIEELKWYCRNIFKETEIPVQ